MSAAIGHITVYDPAPAAGAPVDLGGGLGDGFIFATGADTTSGDCLAVFACCAFDGAGDIDSVSDSVNGAYTVRKDVLDTTFTNQDWKSYHFPNAAVLKASAASFTGSVNGSTQVLTASSVTGTIRVGQLLQGTSVGAMWRIASLGTGTGGAGTYNLNPIATTTIASEAMTTADAISVFVAGFPDFIGGILCDVTGASTSGVTAFAGQAISSSGTDSITSGTAACGSIGGLMIGVASNGTTANSPFAPAAGTGFTHSQTCFTWNVGQATGLLEWQNFASPGTKAATFTPTGTDGFVAMMVFIPDAASSGALAGSSALIFGESGVLTGVGALAGTSAATFGGTGLLRGAGALAGSTAVTFSESGLLTGVGSLSATSALIFGESGQLSATGALSGESDLTFSASGTLIQPGLVGTAAITFGETGTLTGAGALSGESDLAFAATGTLTPPGALVGSASVSFGQSGTLTGLGALIGESDIVITATGTMVQPTPVGFSNAGGGGGSGKFEFKGDRKPPRPEPLFSAEPVPDTLPTVSRQVPRGTPPDTGKVLAEALSSRPSENDDEEALALLLGADQEIRQAVSTALKRLLS